MIFAVRQLQEKCVEQQQDLYLTFVDLTKAFGTVDRNGLWLILSKIGCPARFVQVIRSFHDGMLAQVMESGVMSDSFEVTSGTKQGCVLAPLLFSIYFAAMLTVAFKDSTAGVSLQFRTDRNLFDLRKLQAKSKVTLSIIRDLLFADDCALAAHNLQEAQILLNRFASASRRFGLSISLKKTEVMYQVRPNAAYSAPALSMDGQSLPVADKFCYLGSVVSRDNSLDSEISARLAKAYSAFGRLSARLCSVRDIRMGIKIKVYTAAVLSSLLYGAESWTLYRDQLRKLETFHMSCLRRILRISWRDRVSNVAILRRCKVSGIEAMLLKAQLRWCGHVIRMPDSRIPKQLLYGQLKHGTRNPGGQRKRYKDQLRCNLKACGIEKDHLELLVQDRTAWRSLCYSSINNFETFRCEALIQKRSRRHQVASNPTVFVCGVCQRDCHSRIGLFAHRKCHQ